MEDHVNGARWQIAKLSFRRPTNLLPMTCIIQCSSNLDVVGMCGPVVSPLKMRLTRVWFYVFYVHWHVSLHAAVHLTETPGRMLACEELRLFSVRLSASGWDSFVCLSASGWDSFLYACLRLGGWDSSLNAFVHFRLLCIHLIVRHIWECLSPIISEMLPALDSQNFCTYKRFHWIFPCTQKLVESVASVFPFFTFSVQLFRFTLGRIC